MTITKSLPQNVRVVDGNSVQVYIDEPSGIIYLKDIYGRVEPLSNYLTPSNQILVNVGGGTKVYTENTGLPSQLRTLTQGTNITIIENPTEIQISSSGVGSLENIGTGAEVYITASGNNPAQLRTLKQGSNVVITENANEIEIAATTSGVASLSNIGTGAQIYKSGNNPAELRTLTQGANVVITQNANDIQIAVPSVTGTTLYYGSFYSTQLQTTVGNEQKAMTFNNTDATATLGFSIVANSRITAANAGIYNLEFSAQLKKTSGGGATQIYIWIKKNGVNLPESNTTLSLANNGDLLVAAWNLFLQLNAGQYVELYWYATAASIQLFYNATPVVGLPDIPSVIATINRIG